MRPAAFRNRAPRAIDEPMSPTPMIANSSNIGLSSGGLSRSVTFGMYELGQRGDDAAVGLFAPNRQTPTISAARRL